MGPCEYCKEWDCDEKCQHEPKYKVGDQVVVELPNGNVIPGYVSNIIVKYVVSIEGNIDGHPYNQYTTKGEDLRRIVRE